MPTLIRTVAEAINIRQEEEKPLLLLFAYSFCTGVAIVFFDTGVNALFLSHFSPSTLPYVYGASAVVSLIVGLIYVKGIDRLPAITSGVVTLGGLTLITGLLYTGFMLFDSRWSPAIAMVWRTVFATVLMTHYWSVARRLFDVRQGKRLFSFTEFGRILAGILSGFSIAFLARPLGVVNLLLIAGIATLAGLLVFLLITKRYETAFSQSHHKDEEQEPDTLKSLLKNRYFVLLFGMSGLSLFTAYVIEYVFYGQVVTRYDGVVALAQFFGVFAGIGWSANLIVNLFLSRTLLARYGLSVGLFSLPIADAVGIAVSLILSLFGGAPGFFWGVMATRQVDRLLAISLLLPSLQILHQPLSSLQRAAIRVVRDSMVTPIVALLAGAVLLLCTSVLTLSMEEILGLSVAALFGWVIVSMRLQALYPMTLSNALAKRRLVGTSLTLNDASTTRVLERGIKDTNATTVLYCLNMLGDMEHPAIPAIVISLLAHADARVRLEALRRIERYGLVSAIDEVRRRSEVEPLASVRGKALQTLCLLIETDSVEKMIEYLDDPDPEIRKGVLVGLLQNGGIEGVLNAGVRLNVLFQSRLTEDRLIAATVFGESGIKTFYRPLSQLLQDEDLDVRRMALQSSGLLKHPRLIPLIIQTWSVPAVRDAAVSALVAFGSVALLELERELNSPRATADVRIRIAKIVGRIGGDAATGLLKRRLDTEGNEVRDAMLLGLVNCHFQVDNNTKDRMLVVRAITSEARDAAWALAALEDMGDAPPERRLREALQGFLVRVRHRLFLLLSFLYPIRVIEHAKTNLTQSSEEDRTLALSTLDMLIAADLKPLTLPLLNDLPQSQRLDRLSSFFPQPKLSKTERLKEIITHEHYRATPWTKSVALFMVSRSPEPEFLEAVEVALQDPDSIVRETAVWTAGCFQSDDLAARVKSLMYDPVPAVAAWARRIGTR